MSKRVQHRISSRGKHGEYVTMCITWKVYKGAHRQNGCCSPMVIEVATPQILHVECGEIAHTTMSIILMMWHRNIWILLRFKTVTLNWTQAVLWHSAVALQFPLPCAACSSQPWYGGDYTGVAQIIITADSDGVILADSKVCKPCSDIHHQILQQ